jgi:hypothetical protein
MYGRLPQSMGISYRLTHQVTFLGLRRVEEVVLRQFLLLRLTVLVGRLLAEQTQF